MIEDGGNHGSDHEAVHIVGELLAKPVPAVDLTLAKGPAFFAWWVDTSGLTDTEPEIPSAPNPSDPTWSLLYVAGSPGSAAHSHRPLHRVVSNHLQGNVSSSTLRFSLASLLIEKLKLVPRASTVKPRFIDERPLSKWMAMHCGISWVQFDEPWQIEKLIIAKMNPPLCIRSGKHPFRYALHEARLRVFAECGVKRTAMIR